MAVSVGTRLGPYEVLSPVGAGGMGVVYLARDTRLDRLVALKFVPPHLSEEPEQRRQLIQEARAASALDHPNIGVVHEIDETLDGHVFLAMAYYEGQSLKNRIAAGLSFGEAAEIGRQIAQGLDYAHRHAVIHRSKERRVGKE